MFRLYPLTRGRNVIFREERIPSRRSGADGLLRELTQSKGKTRLPTKEFIFVSFVSPYKGKKGFLRGGRGQMASFGSSRKARGRQDSQQRSSSLFRLYLLARGRKDSFEEVGGKWVSFGSSRKARGRQDLYKELACFCMDLLPRSEMNRFKEVGGRCAAQASITAGRRRYDKEKSGE